MAVNLPPRQKTAILLMSLPPEASAEIFKELGPEEVQNITMEISKLPQISPETRAQVIQEFLGQSDSAPDGLKDLGTTTPAAGGGFPGLGAQRLGEFLEVLELRNAVDAAGLAHHLDELLLEWDGKQ